MTRQGGDHIVGVISDTHGLLRPEAVAELEGSALIVHAGDIGEPEVLDTLRKIAPVIAVRGNTDKGRWAHALPKTEVLEVGEFSFYVLHDLGELDLDPAAAAFRVVIFGHSHRPEVRERNGVMFLNPGSAGPRRFNLPVTVARLRIRDGNLDAAIVELGTSRIIMRA
ncbi:MAG: metallophosphoesterase family protein [Candidatus Methylomirabilales bacterium]